LAQHHREESGNVFSFSPSPDDGDCARLPVPAEAGSAGRSYGARRRV